MSAPPPPIEVVYLEMREPPAPTRLVAPIAGVALRPDCRIGVDLYRRLYREVGEPWSWDQRTGLSDAALGAILVDPRLEVSVLEVDGAAGGFVELDSRLGDEVLVAYFGLLPELIGRGLGRYFLDWSVRRAWLTRPRRLWLATSSLDHPRALANYLEAGFVEFDRKRVSGDRTGRR